MPDKIDLTGFADAINGALSRQRPTVISVVDVEGRVSSAARGSTYIYSDDQLALWARKRDEGLAASVEKNPDVSVFYFDPSTSPSIIRIHGRARTDLSLNDTVHAGIPKQESDHDPEKNGVAIIIDVDWLMAFGYNYPFTLQSK